MRLILALVLVLAAVDAGPSRRRGNPKQHAITCEQCTQTVSNVLGGIDGPYNETVAAAITAVCELLHIEDANVCKSMVGSFKDEVLFLAEKMVIDQDLICGVLITDCGPIPPFDHTDSEWTIPIPGGRPAPQPVVGLKGGERKLRVLHISDLHVDLFYQVGAEAECGEPNCCRSPSMQHEFAAKEVKVPAGRWGTIGDCDTPYWTLANMVEHIKATHTDIDYVVVSGDLASHEDWYYTKDAHAALVANISATLNSLGVPVFFTVGNHEGVPIDNFAPHNVDVNGDKLDLWAAGFDMDYLYGTAARTWTAVPDDQKTQLNKTGSYMAQVVKNGGAGAPGLRIVSLNTGLGDPMNFWLFLNQSDPDGVMSWFRDQLLAAETAGDKVHVVAHIPGGSSEAHEGWAINYYNLINRFNDTVTAQFFGHTHSEEFYVMYADPDSADSTPTGVIWSAPSVTPESSFNPAYRIYSIRGQGAGSHYEVLDWEEWFLNLTVANQLPAHVSPTWEVLYDSVLQTYGMASCAPSEWHNLIKRMTADDYLFENYRKNYYRRSDLDPCDADCRRGYLCDARQARHSDNLCADLNVVDYDEGMLNPNM